MIRVLRESVLNQITLSGQLIERKALRYTPAGVAVSEARLFHQSSLIENGSPRAVELEVSVLALGESARWLEAVSIGDKIKISGFLAARSRNSRSTVIHANTIEYLEGNENGTVLQEEA